MRSVFEFLYRLPQRLLIGAVHFYRLFFRAWVGNVCRFTPTCSAYSLEALRQHGAMGGTYLTVRRLLRCHPGCPGGDDPVPPRGARLFSRLVTPSSSEADASDSSTTRFTLPEKTRT